MLGQENLGSGAIPPLGSVIGGRFELLQQLGACEKGSSFKARDSGSGSGKLFVLKFLNQTLSTNDYLEAKRLELKSTLGLLHPNLLGMLELEQDSQFGFYFVREFIAGRSLSELLREKGVLNQIEFIDIFQQACKGLAYSHKKKCLHGDLKPGNLIITEDYVLRLVDFCLGKGADPRDDIFMLGSVMYESLGASQPFASARQECPTPFLSLIPARNVDPQIETVILRCLVKENEQRYQSVDALQSDLKRIEEGEEIKALSLKPPVLSGKLVVISLAIGVLVLLAGGIAFSFFAKPADNKNVSSPSDELARENAREQALAADEAKADRLCEREKYEEAAEIYNKIEPVILEKYGAESREHVKILHKMGRADLWNKVSGQAKNNYIMLGEILHRHPDLAPKQYRIHQEIFSIGKKILARGDYKAADDAFSLSYKLGTKYDEQDRPYCNHVLIWEAKSEGLCGDFENSEKDFDKVIKFSKKGMLNPDDLDFALTEYGAMLMHRAEGEAAKKETQKKAEEMLKQALELRKSHADRKGLAETKKLLKSLYESEGKKREAQSLGSD